MLDPEQMALFVTLLGLGANALTAGLVVARLAGRGDALAAALGPSALGLAAGVAVTATLGSLWFSEVADYAPCTLCWYQRIAMYPLAIVLVVAALRRDRGVRAYVLPLALAGAIVSTYHYLIEWFPDLESGGACDPAVPCTAVWFRELGFVTLAYLALSGFLAIVALLTLVPRTPRPAPEVSP